MRALVTGGCGFIGSNLCNQLHTQPWVDWDITVVDDLSTGHAVNKMRGINYIHESITTPEFMTNLVGELRPDVIFHLAALPRISFSIDHPDKTFNANVAGTVAVLDAVRKNGLQDSCRVVFSSSSSVYGDAKVFPTPETATTQPLSPYALQKLQAEQWCRVYAELYGLDVVSLRYFSVFGPGNRHGGAYSTVFTAWLYALLIDPNAPLILEGDGTQSRDFCYVNNVVRANISCALREKSFHGQMYNIAQGSSTNLLECKKLIEEITGKELHLRMTSSRAGDVRHTLADISAAHHDLEYTPSTDLKEQLRSMIEWYETEYKAEVYAKNTHLQA